MLAALTRCVPRSIEDCLLTYMDRESIDLERAESQHAAYEAALRSAGFAVQPLPAIDSCPDSVFMEDTGIILDEVAVIGNMATPERGPEAQAVRGLVSELRPVVEIKSPGTLEGGDIFRIEKTIFVGLGTRTNPDGAGQLQDAVQPFGYEVITVPVPGCLHLSTGASHIGGGEILANTNWVESAAFGARTVIAVPEDEPWGANALLAHDTLLVAAGNPKTRELLESTGRSVIEVDISEFAKAEAGLTCLSLRYTKTD